MWGQTDFEQIEALYDEAAEDYSKPGPRNARARMLLLSTHNLHDFRVELEKTAGGLIDDRHYMQLSYLRRGVQALKSTYWLLKHHAYSACYGRMRFLLELYLVVRELNREKEKTKEKWKRAVEDLKQNDYRPYDKIFLTKFFEGKRQQLMGEFTDQHDVYDTMYGRISGAGAHPDSIKSSHLEGSLDEVQERDIIDFGLTFVYAIAAQYRRTFEDSPLQKPVEIGTDGILMQAVQPLDGLPSFLEDDLDFFEPI